MSFYHLHLASNNDEDVSFELPEEVVISLEDRVNAFREGLLAFCVSAGLGALEQVLGEEVRSNVGPKGKHNPDRDAFRHGSTVGNWCWEDNGQEIPPELYRLFQDEDLLREEAFRRIIQGLAGRRYDNGLESMGEEVEKHSESTSKSSVSRRFIQGAQKELLKLMLGPLDERRYPALMLDGIEFVQHMVVAALGIDVDGNKHVLGIWQGPTPGAASSLREWLQETLTVTRLGLPALLRETMCTTNPVESAFSMVREMTKNVKRWRDGNRCCDGLRQLCSKRRDGSTASRAIGT